MTVTRLLRALAAGLVVAGAAALVVSPAVASGQNSDFVNGSGRADAKILRMGPSAGRLSLAPTIGLALADYVGTLGRGESRTADWAALDGSVPEDFKAELPTVRAESSEEDAGTPHTAGFASTPDSSPIRVGASSQSATASRDPKGASHYTLGSYAIPGLVEVGASTADAHAAVVGGATREAVGISKVSSVVLGGGAVTLHGLTWEAVQRTGDKAGASATFRVEGVTIGAGPLAQKLTVPDNGTGLDQVLGPINAALKPSGLILAAPSRSTEAGIARVGPLGIQVADSEVGRTVLGPILGQLQPIRDPITGALINFNPEFSTAVLLADVAVGIFSGAGRNDIELGGATAFTEGQVFDNPFGAFDFGSFTLPSASGDGSFSLGDSNGGDAGSNSPALGGISSGSIAGAPGGPASGATAAAGTGQPAGSQVRSAMPLGVARTIAGKRGGAAALIGALGLIAALGVGYADYRRLRNNGRTIVVS